MKKILFLIFLVGCAKYTTTDSTSLVSVYGSKIKPIVVMLDETRPEDQTLCLKWYVNSQQGQDLIEKCTSLLEMRKLLFPNN